MNKKIIMLSGDNAITANIIAQNLKIDEVIANCLPQDKEKYLKELQQSKHTVMMIGDGINDAPSLTSSDIGVSMNSATDINCATLILPSISESVLRLSIKNLATEYHIKYIPVNPPVLNLTFFFRVINNINPIRHQILS